MKRFLRITCSFIFVFLITVFAGCKGCKSKIHPTAIKSWDLPKSTYELGEYLDLTGSTVKVEYSDGSTEDHEVTYDMVSVFDLLNVYGSTGQHALQVTYVEGDYKVTFETQITVTIQAFRSAAISAINEYKQGTQSIYSAENTSRIEELKLIARSAIYAAADETEVDEIKAKTIEAIDTVATRAEQEIADGAAEALRQELLKKIGDVQDNVNDLNTAITTTISTLYTKAEAEALAQSFTGELTNEVNKLNERIDNLDPGTGTPAKKVVLQKGETHIQWKYEDDTEWTDLIEIADLIGPAGAAGAQGPAGAAGAQGPAGAAGAAGEDGEDGRGISAISLTDEGKLKFEFDNGDDAVEIDLSSVLTPAATLEAELQALKDKVDYQLDENNADSIQAQINKVAEDLAALTALVEGLSIQDTFDGLQDQINDIVNFFTNSGVDLTDASANATKLLESILADKVESFSTAYLSRTYTLDEFKELLTDELLPKAKEIYGAAKLVKTILKNCYNVVSDDTLTMKQKLTGVIDELRAYDEVLLEMGVDAETVAKIQTKLQSFKEQLLDYVKEKINDYVDTLSATLVKLYDLDELLSMAGSAQLLSYQAEINTFLSEINYTGAADYATAINNIKDAVDSLTYRNAFSVLKTIVNQAFDLVQIDSLNDILPALLAATIEEYYNTYVGQLAEYLSVEEATAVCKAKDKFVMAILRTKSAVNAVEYASAAKTAIAETLMATSLGTKVELVHAKIEENDVTAAQVALDDLDDELIRMTNNGVYAGVLLAQVEAQYIANYTSRFSIIYYNEYYARTLDPSDELYGKSSDYIFDNYVQPLTEIEVYAIMSDAGTVASIENDILNIISPIVKNAVDALYKAVYGVDYDVHAYLGM